MSLISDLQKSPRKLKRTKKRKIAKGGQVWSLFLAFFAKKRYTPLCREPFYWNVNVT